MNLPARDLFISFEVGKSGGSTGQPCDIKRSRRGLVEEQGDPLVLWWVRLLRKENSADQFRESRESRSRRQSYRRSRWGDPAGSPVSPISPFLAMHKDGRLLNSPFCAFIGPFVGTLVGTLIGLTASLNMVAMAEPAISSIGRTAVSADEIPSAERFSMMKDFVGQHHQYLDLSKLNEFKWTDETRVAARPLSKKRQINGVSALQGSGLIAQPQAVPSKMQQPNKNDAELTGQLDAPGRQSETGSIAGSRSISGGQSDGQAQTNSKSGALLDSASEPN
jgi:hypothetical protein